MGNELAGARVKLQMAALAEWARERIGERLLLAFQPGSLSILEDRGEDTDIARADFDAVNDRNLLRRYVLAGNGVATSVLPERAPRQHVDGVPGERLIVI